MKPVALESICEFKNGRGFKKTEWCDSGLPIIRIQNLNKYDAPFNYYQGKYDKAIEVNHGDLLFSWSGTIGSSFGAHIWERETGVLNQHIFKVNLSDSVDNRFAYHALQWITAEIEKKVNGAVGLVHITKAKLNKFTIPLPPLPEQKRIVAILDETFAGIDVAVANTEKNLVNARELFESYLNDVFTRKGDGWVEEPLGEIATFSQGKQVGLKEQLTEAADGYVRFVRIVDYTQNTDDVRYVLDPGMKYHAAADDIVMVRYGSPGLIGRGISGIIANNLFKINVTKKVVTNDYLALFLMQKTIQDFLSTRGSSTMPALNFGHVENIPVQYPAIDTQVRIVEKVELLRDETNRLESIYQQKLTALAELKQSILQKAFAGELTAQPEKTVEEAVA